jgi:gliding motility-associated-like protein
VRFFVRISLLLLTLFTCFNKLTAQLCQGSLGDPIVNITFGAGANPGPALLAATTTYQYVSTDCPNDGYYTLRNNTNSCFGNSWYSLSSDHTGDKDGYFMLVNASVQPSAFYLGTVSGLCGGTTYEFAAWIINVLRPSACLPSPTQPNLTFTLEKKDGSVLQSYNTGTITSSVVPTWQQFGFFFATPPDVTEVVIRIFNNAPGGCGNDLALDDITFRPCGPRLDASILGIANDTVSICEGSSRTYTFNCDVSTGFNNPSYQWQQSSDGITWNDIAGANTTSLTKNFTPANTPGKYMYRLAAAEAGNLGTPQCRIASKLLMVDIAANPVPLAGSNSPICEEEDLILNATSGTEYQWSGVNNFTANGESVTVSNVQTTRTGKYYVLVTNAAGCTKLDSVNVIVNPKPRASVSFSTATICEEDNLLLHSSGGSKYQWIPATGLSAENIASPIASPAVTTDYSVIVSNQFECSDTAKVVVNVNETPRANAGSDKWIIEGNPVQLSATATGQDINYSWTPVAYINDPQSLQPVVNPPRDTTFVLSVSSTNGCGTATDTMKVFVFKDIYIPSAFTPNNDGLNDTWNIPALNAFPEFELKVFNRQGQLIYQNKNSNIPWDGRYKGEAQPAGVYVYYVDLKVPGGKRKGTLTLIR